MVKVYYRVMNLILTNILSIIIGFILGGCWKIAIDEKNANVREDDDTYKRTGTMGFCIDT